MNDFIEVLGLDFENCEIDKGKAGYHVDTNNGRFRPHIRYKTLAKACKVHARGKAKGIYLGRGNRAVSVYIDGQSKTVSGWIDAKYVSNMPYLQDASINDAMAIARKFLLTDEIVSKNGFHRWSRTSILKGEMTT